MENNISLISQPTFLVGAEHSCTTLLGLMLDHHPQISCYHEFEYAVDLIRGNNFPKLQDYYQFLETNRIFQSSGFEIDPKLDYPQLINSFLEQKQQGKPPCGVVDGGKKVAVKDQADPQPAEGKPQADYPVAPVIPGVFIGGAGQLPQQRQAAEHGKQR